MSTDLAAELRRLADKAMRISDADMAGANQHPQGCGDLLLGRSLGSAAVAHLLRARADELDGGAR